jgi:hypothetical protein
MIVAYWPIVIVIKAAVIAIQLKTLIKLIVDKFPELCQTIMQKIKLLDLINNKRNNAKI